MTLVMSFVFPFLPLRTTPTRLAGLVTDTVSLLRNARSRAITSDGSVAATFDADDRVLRSGGETVAVPPDVVLSVSAGANCPKSGARTQILFRPDGTNCGGVLRFTRDASSLRVRVNWMDGQIDVAPGR